MSDLHLASKEKSDSVSTVVQVVPVIANDTLEQKRILRKLDVHLLPLITLLYLLSFLDRSNVGNARVAGMAKDLHLVGLQYNIIAGVFFVTYALFEVPSNIILKRLRPSVWIPSIMVAWGLVMTLMSLCNSYHAMIVARIFLGITEAGFFPGITYYLSLWYRPKDIALRISIFFSAATVAGAFGGLLAYGIERMEGIAGLHGWQWIFCLEGTVTVLVAVSAFFLMYDYPSTASFLTPDERQFITKLLEDDARGQATHFDKKFVISALTDYKTYILAFTFHGVLITVYAISLFLPTIINDLGYTAAHAQLLTVPPFFAACIFTLILGFASDMYNSRAPFVIGSCFVSLAGFVLLYNTQKAAAGYAGAFIAAIGIFPITPILIAWVTSACGGQTRKGVTIAVVATIGNLGGITASFIFRNPPRFHIGHGTVMGALGLTILLTAFSMWNFNRLNKANETRCQVEKIDESRWAEFRDMGNDSPLFRYTL